MRIENGVDREYWASKTIPDELATCSNDRIKRHFTTLEAVGVLSRVRASDIAFYGSDASGGWKESSFINFGGETGELVGVVVNEYSDLIRRRVTLMTQDRPVFKVIAGSPGTEAEEQARLSQQLLERDIKCGNLERSQLYCPLWSEKYGEGWVYQWWDKAAGEMLMDQMARPTQAGEARSTAKTVYDIVRDPEEDPLNPDWPRWVGVRVQRNRYDLMSEFPKFESEILDAQPENRGLHVVYENWAGTFSGDSSDQSLIDTWVFYHRPCPALPEGRRWVLVGDTIVSDGIYNLPDLPVSPMIPFFRNGTPYGHSIAWDLLGPQALLNATMTTAHSNHDRFGSQVIWTPGSAPPDIVDGGHGLQLLVSEDEPKVLSLNSVVEDTYKLREIVSKDMRTISAISNVGRGETSDSRSGSSLAAEVAQSMQFLGPFQRAYAKLIESVGTVRINLWKRHATLERTGEVLGLDSTPTPQKWNSESIQGAKRVYVEVGSSSLMSAGGRVSLADTFAERGWIKTPEQYAQVMDTGRVEGLYDTERDHRRLAELENDRLRKGEPVQCLLLDHHHDHIHRHLALLSDPRVRFDFALAKQVTDHIKEHEALWEQMSEGQLALLGMVPYVMLQPAIMATQGPPMLPEGGPMPEGDGGPPMEGPAPEGGDEAMRYEAAGVPEEIGGAQLPVMPKSPDGTPMNPQGGF